MNKCWKCEFKGSGCRTEIYKIPHHSCIHIKYKDRSPWDAWHSIFDTCDDFKLKENKQ
jgi:hypothetical protein